MFETVRLMKHIMWCFDDSEGEWMNECQRNFEILMISLNYSLDGVIVQQTS